MGRQGILSEKRRGCRFSFGFVDFKLRIAARRSCIRIRDGSDPTGPRISKIRLLCQALRLPACSVKTAKGATLIHPRFRKLVADCGITIAEIARQAGYPHLPFQRAWRAVIPASQQRPYFFPLFFPLGQRSNDCLKNLAGIVGLDLYLQAAPSAIHECAWPSFSSFETDASAIEIVVEAWTVKWTRTC